MVYQEGKAMTLIGTSALRALQVLVVVVVAVALDGCGISIRQPINNATVTSPAKVEVTGNASFTGLRVSVDGNDFSSQMVATGSSYAVGDISLPTGPHTITASATISCWYCSGGSSQTSTTRLFAVAPCARTGNAPILPLSPQIITIGQQPGRRI